MQLNRFSFHETDFLANDLAKLLRQPDIGSEAEIDASRIAPYKSHAAFPGIIVLHDGRPCAAMSYSREPGATVVVSQPVVLIHATDHVRRNLYDVLLRRIQKGSVEFGFLQMNFLKHDSFNDLLFMRLAAERGFVPSASISQWELSILCGSAERQADLKNSDKPLELGQRDRTVHRFNITDTNGDEVREVQTALDAILRCSDDLPSQPRPLAVELLAKWQSIGANIFTCRVQGKIAGILSCVECTATDSTTEIDKGGIAESGSRKYASIEYIGVVREFRRQQSASWLIGQIPLLLHQNGQGVTQASRPAVTIVTAFSDAANSPATGLYQSRGFVRVAAMQLWCCDLLKEQSGKSVSYQS